MQEKTQKQRGGTLRLVRRFGEFMTGSGWKYFGCVLTVGVTVLVSFVTPLLIGGTVDAITDALSGRTGAALDDVFDAVFVLSAQADKRKQVIVSIQNNVRFIKISFSM